MFIRPDGSGIQVEPGRRKMRGRCLSEQGVLQLRDLVHYLLLQNVGISAADLQRVMRGANKDHLGRRLKQIAPGIEAAGPFGEVALMVAIVEKARRRDEEERARRAARGIWDR